MEKIMVCKLKDLMDKRNLNIAQLAREVGMTETTIRAYMKNTFSRIDCQNAVKLCSYFGVTIGDMFDIVDA
ncbi:helix-turn-helix transcriptional regulator [Dolichospermum sp. UHCC 0259]|uniref:helix-turn-helix domain-containing protein n=1 Tax=Dolichospermum sp. UHCC 0259 TaxID=2590010 RepID=UPI0014481E51|nr:helix-turn-helix transcriptional regulator [Dolichospermum sp. UHCC 0259]MTJ49115.1 helix-turn-helix transcriptional regulator [Dolichospermum sp. UHCC 0259]